MGFSRQCGLLQQFVQLLEICDPPDILLVALFHFLCVAGSHFFLLLEEYLHGLFGLSFTFQRVKK
jgi:hypothetical protein